jgi:hypothetical protein
MELAHWPTIPREEFGAQILVSSLFNIFNFNDFDIQPYPQRK